MIAEGIAKYEDAMALIETLKENGIDANITVGGIRVNPRLSDVQRAREICENAGAYVSDSNTSLSAQMAMIGHAERTGSTVDVELFK